MKAIIWYNKVVKEEIEVPEGSVVMDEDFMSADITDEALAQVNAYVKEHMTSGFSDCVQGTLCRLSIPEADYFCEF